MVQVKGTTYRIVRLMPKSYQAVRILDDLLVGSFRCDLALEVTPVAVDSTEMRQIAQAAIRQAKTSWVGSLALVAGQATR